MVLECIFLRNASPTKKMCGYLRLHVLLKTVFIDSVLSQSVIGGYQYKCFSDNIFRQKLKKLKIKYIEIWFQAILSTNPSS